MHDQNDKWINELTSRLKNSSDAIPHTTMTKIRDIRHQALQPRHTNWSNSWLGYTTLAAACMLTLVIGFNLKHRTLDDQTMDDDLELLISAEDLDIYENLEFYQWLESTGRSS